MQTGTTDPKKIRIGEILLSRRLISRLELNAALAHQKRWGGRIGSVLTHLGFITEEVLTNVLAEIYRLPIVNLAKTEVSEEASRTISFDLAKKHNVLALKVEPGGRKTLHLAVSEPANMEVLDEIRFLTGIGQIKIYLSGESDIRNAIERVYLSRANPGRAVLYSPLKMDEGASKGPEMVIIRGGKEELLRGGLDQGEKGASGSLADMGLTDIIQILGAGGKTAEITLQCKGEEGIIYLEAGLIVHAVQRYLQGDKAFFEMLKWNEGSFTIIPVETIRTRTIRMSNDALILEGLRQQDEAGMAPAKEDDSGIALHEVGSDSSILVDGPGGSGGPAMDLGEAPMDADGMPDMLGLMETPMPGSTPMEAPHRLTPPPAQVAQRPTPTAPVGDTGQARRPFAPLDVQLKLLLKLLLKKGIISEQETRIILYGKP